MTAGNLSLLKYKILSVTTRKPLTKTAGQHCITSLQGSYCTVNKGISFTTQEQSY